MKALPFLDLPPLAGASGTVRLPGSKSISNRVLLLAGLAEGTTVLHDLLDSDDTRVMLAALRALGCGLAEDGTNLRVTGLGGRLQVHQAQLFLGNAGTAMRPLTAALAVLAATQGGSFELSGVPRMHERPIGDLVDALRPLGCTIDDLGKPGYPPLRLRGEAGGRLATDQAIHVRGDVSSQFLTALLLALPLVADEHDVVIAVDGELISKPYIQITLNLLARFGITVQREGWARFTIPAGSRYRTPGHIHVEGDASSASYFIALGAIAAHGGAPVRIEGVGLDSIQGDIRFVEAAQAMGAQVHGGPGWLAVHRGAWPLRAIRLDCNHIPDAAMTLAVMALYADGTTRLDNIASWRVKETDRIAAMAAELRAVGATVTEGADFIEVTPPTAWRTAAIHTYDDHRMAMCLSLAAFNPARAAGAHPRSALRGQDLPGVLRGVVRRGACAAGGRAGDHSGRPHRLRQGHAGGRAGAAPGLRAAGFRRAVPAPLAWRRWKTGSRPTTRPRWPAWPATLDLRFADGRTWLRGRDVTDALARRAGRHAGPRGFRPCRRCAQPCTGCSWPSAARRAWWPTGATWAPWSSPTPRSRSSSRPAPRSVPPGAISS